MESQESRSLFRYFLPSDSFVRILVREGGCELRARPGLNRSAYRRLVIEACCPDLRADLGRELERMCPHDPLAAEDQLYQLCVEVNPQLDIHTVRLRPEGDPSARSASGGAGADLDPQAWRQQLARRAQGLGERLRRRIVGQDAALGAVERCVRKAAAGLAQEGRPLGTFLFLGRTGTGKTELARTLGAELFGRRGEPEGAALLRFDCSEYALAHEYAKLIGAPPGYIGHDQGGALTDTLRRRPDCVVLFDEIEKAHPRMHSLLLQVLDEGRLTDARGRTADFSRALVVLTSNAGAAEVQAAARPVGFGAPSPIGERNLAEITGRALESTFSPEFLGRIDERIVFRELTPADAAQIAERLLADLALRARRQGLRVAFARSVALWIAARGFSPAAGARELRRVVQRDLEAPLAELLLQGRPPEGQILRASVRRGTLSLRPA